MAARNQITNKEDIRREVLRLRDGISAREHGELSLAICRGVSEDDRYLDARAVHVYLPIGSEVDIMPLVDLAWEMGKGVGMMQVMADGGIAHYAIERTTEYRKSALGILEPVDAEPFDMETCDLVIVPLVAADQECNRIGYGKGYYDQFLAQHPRPTIGVAFDVQLVPSIPADSGDVQLDCIYTETRILNAE